MKYVHTLIQYIRGDLNHQSVVEQWYVRQPSSFNFNHICLLMASVWIVENTHRKLQLTVFIKWCLLLHSNYIILSLFSFHCEKLGSRYRTPATSRFNFLLSPRLLLEKVCILYIHNKRALISSQLFYLDGLLVEK